MRTFDELLDDLVHRARWERDEVESAKRALRSMRDAAVAAELERCKARAVQIVEWHRNDYNRQQIDPIVAELRSGL